MVQILDKLYCRNYQEVTRRECEDPDLREIINFNLAQKPENRIKLQGMMDKIKTNFEYQSNYEARMQKRQKKISKRETWEVPIREESKDMNEILDSVQNNQELNETQIKK